MRCFHRSAPLIAAITVSLYLPFALIPTVTWAQATRESGNTADGDGAIAAQSNTASHSEELPDISDVDRTLASLPAGGAPLSGNAVALPSGPASTLGMGESFSAQLSTGTAALTVPFSLPSARGRVQPSLTLSYSSAGGFGLAGVGWSLGTAAITRQTDRGIPSYDDRPDFHPAQDRFMFGGAELVPICTVKGSACAGALDGERMPSWANGWQYFRPRHEGSFVRAFWSPDHRTWRVQSKDGTNMELGVPLDGTQYHEALEFNVERPKEISRWYLVREYDSQGGANDAMPRPLNVIVFRYFHDDGVAYLSDIYDTSPASDPTSTDLARFAHHTAIRYEHRPDRAVSYRAGFRMSYRLRIAGVDVTSKPFDGASVTTAPRELVRRYHLGYAHGRHASLLATVQPEGRCAQPITESSTGALPVTSCARLPAVRFEYQEVDSDSEPLRDGSGQAFEPIVDDVLALADSPPHSLDERDVALVDANLDGLPDVLATSPSVYQGQHAIFLNGSRGELGFRERRLVSVEPLQGVTAGVLRLSNVNVAAMDMDADGALDLVHMPFVKRYEVFSLSRKGDGFGWVGREVTTAAEQNPKINFATDARDTRVMDVNGDGLVDIVYTTPTEIQTFFALGRFPGGDGRYGQGTWTGPTTASLTTEPVRSCAPWSAKSIRFSSPDVHVADMNGDGLPDLVRVRDRQVLYWPGRGNGMWGEGSRDNCRAGQFGEDRHVEMTRAPNLGVTAPGRMLLADLNGDGLSDMVELRTRAVDVYLNDNGEAWTERFTLQNTPFLPNSSSYVQLSDIDGSGTPDLVWGKAREYKYVDLTGGVTPNLLIRTHNGLGRTMTLSYRAMTELMREAERSQHGWVSKAPSAAQVIVGTEVTDNLQRIGRTPTRVITEYSYRDAVFEGREREFRGFREAITRNVGDVKHPTSLVRSTFLLGECVDDVADEVDICSPKERWHDHGREGLKGLSVLTEAYDEQNVFHSTQHSMYELRQLYSGRDGRDVQVVYPVAKHALLYDTADFDGEATPTTLPELRFTAGGEQWEAAGHLVRRSERGHAFTSSETTFDNFGNVLEVREHGCSGQGCEGGTDETLIAHSEYTLPAGDASGWLWREERSYVTGSVQTEHRNEVRHTYDAQGNLLRSFATLRGTLRLQRSHVSGEPIAANPAQQSGGIEQPAEIMLKDNTFDQYGHITWKREPEGACSSSEVDPAYAHLVVSGRTYVGSPREDGCGSVVLRQFLTYDRGLEQITDSRDANDRLAHFDFDGLGRLVSATPANPARPRALAAMPAVRISYDLTTDPWQRPYSITRVETLDGPTANEGVYRESYAFMDGLGRTLHSMSPAEPGDGEWLVSGPADYDAKGAEWRACLPFYFNGDPLSVMAAEIPTTDPAGASSEPGSGCASLERDAFGRTTKQYGYDAQLVSFAQYHALSSDAFDANDLPGGERADTYATGVVDGHGRQVMSIERYHEQGALRERRQLAAYLPTGEVTRVTLRASGQPDLVRWMRYDSLGRLVLNVEPNTSVNFTADETVPADSVRALRYAYDDAGRLVGTSDARGCGVNYFYDAAGRPLASDYSPCEAHHDPYTVPNLADGTGTETFYRYDTADGDVDAIVDAKGAKFEVPNLTVLGSLHSVSDRGSKAIYRYDLLGRVTGVALRLAKPGNPGTDVAARFAPRWYTREIKFDGLDRPTSISTGATTPELRGDDGSSELLFAYGVSGVLNRVDSSYGNLLAEVSQHADGRVKHLRMGDAASTERSFFYDINHRLQTAQTLRSNLSWWTNPPAHSSFEPPGPGEAPTQQMLLEDLEYRYDRVGNVIAIDDYRAPADWPGSVQPVSRAVRYDDLYRITQADYTYAGSSLWKSPYTAELSEVQREQPTPHVSFEQRVARQTFNYDAFNRISSSDDDAHAFWDRSTGTRAFGTAQSGPHQLRTASNRAGAGASTRRGDLEARYDDAGNMTDLVVKRDGPCLPTTSSCWQRFHYQWDEIGNLVRARRWDLALGTEREQFAKLSVAASQAPPARTPESELRYAYSGTQRVLKTSIRPSGARSHTVYIFDSLELRHATFATDYALNADTEQVRLSAGAVVGRVIFSEEDLPSLTSGGRHVFLQFTDHLGSSSFSVDHETGELVEYTTYTAFGGVESSYRPERWESFREPYKFTGKEEDIELGLVYYGARYYSSYAATWMSPDPVNIHELGSDINPYGYVGGSPLMNVDPDGRDYGIGATLLIAAVIAAAIAATSSAVAQGTQNGWSNIDWGVKGVAGAGLAGFASGLIGGYVGGYIYTAAAWGGYAAAGAIAGGAAGGAVGGATGYLVHAGASGQGVTGAGLGRAVGLGAASGLVSSAVSGIQLGNGSLGESWFGATTAAASGTATGTGLSVAMGGSFDSTDFAISLGASLAGVLAHYGVAQGITRAQQPRTGDRFDLDAERAKLAVATGPNESIFDNPRALATVKFNCKTQAECQEIANNVNLMMPMPLTLVSGGAAAGRSLFSRFVTWLLGKGTGQLVSGAATTANPLTLLGRQTASEMRSGIVTKMIAAMKNGTFDWAKAGAVEVAERDGVRIIIDGHHRVAAAIRAGIKEVPIVVREVSNEAWEVLMKEHLDTLWGM